jgi:hypothetical protein
LPYSNGSSTRNRRSPALAPSGGPLFECEVVIPSDAQNGAEALTAEPVVELVDLSIIPFEPIAHITTVDEDVSLEDAELVLHPVGVADDDEPHH